MVTELTLAFNEFCMKIDDLGLSRRAFADSSIVVVATTRYSALSAP
jgi:hypothetical protein